MGGFPTFVNNLAESATVRAARFKPVGYELSGAVAIRMGKSSPLNDATCAGCTSCTGCREFSPSDSECQKWRRRDANGTFYRRAKRLGQRNPTQTKRQPILALIMPIRLIRLSTQHCVCRWERGQRATAGSVTQDGLSRASEGLAVALLWAPGSKTVGYEKPHVVFGSPISCGWRFLSRRIKRRARFRYACSVR